MIQAGPALELCDALGVALQSPPAGMEETCFPRQSGREVVQVLRLQLLGVRLRFVAYKR